MEQIDLVISNPNNKTYPNIVLRKYFCMLFLDRTGKKLTAYFATVFSGCNEWTDEEPTFVPSFYQKNNKDVSKPTIKFKFSQNNSPLSVSSIDITDSFIKQGECVAKVWGLLTPFGTQSDITNKLSELYRGSQPNVGTMTPDDRKFFFLDDGTGKQKPRNTHQAVVTPGGYSENDTKDGYSLTCYPYDYVEAINWVKVDIAGFKSNFLNSGISFSVKLDGCFYAPDFTWYFAPPVGYVIDEKTRVKVEGEGGIKDEKANCLQTVDDATTVLFKEWVNMDEPIDERKKIRLLTKALEADDSSSNLGYLSRKKLTVLVHPQSQKQTTNKQFLLGIVVSFVLSFFTDATRTEKIYSAFCGMNSTNICCAFWRIVGEICPIFITFLIAFTFVTFTFDPKKNVQYSNVDDEEKKKFEQLHFWSLFFSVSFFLSHIALIIFPRILLFVVCVLIYSVSLFLNLRYYLRCTRKYKRRIINFI